MSGAPARPKKESLKHTDKDTDKNMSTKNKKRIEETMTDHNGAPVCRPMSSTKAMTARVRSPCVTLTFGEGSEAKAAASRGRLS